MKPPPDIWWISFTYDPAHDIVEAHFRDVVLETEEDVLCWRREVERRFQRFGRPVDLLINLDGLIVKPSAARVFGAHRAEVLAEHTRMSFRYNGNLQTRTSIYTSAVIHGADANLYESREEALKALLAHREAGTVPNRAPVGPPSQRAPLSQSFAAPQSQKPASSGPMSQRPTPPPGSGPPAPGSPPQAQPISSTPPPPSTGPQGAPRQGPLSKR